MVVSKWIKFGESKDCKEIKKDRAKGKLFDVAHEALTNRTESGRIGMESLIKTGWPHVWQERFRSKVKKRVQEVIADELTADEVIEEVTEKIVLAAEDDEYYRKMFDN